MGRGEQLEKEILSFVSHLSLTHCHSDSLLSQCCITVITHTPFISAGDKGNIDEIPGEDNYNSQMDL